MGRSFNGQESPTLYGFNILAGSDYIFRRLFFFIKGPLRGMDGSSLRSLMPGGVSSN